MTNTPISTGPARTAKASRRPSSAGIKALITASSITATLLGWAIFTSQASNSNVAATNVATNVVTTDGSSPAPIMQPLPTLAPLVEFNSSLSAPALSAPAQPTQPAPPAQPQTVQPARPRRSVRLPAPAATTRSSR